jgi:hypothetical protein
MHLDLKISFAIAVDITLDKQQARFVQDVQFAPSVVKAAAADEPEILIVMSVTRGVGVHVGDVDPVAVRYVKVGDHITVRTDFAFRLEIELELVAPGPPR